MSGANTLNHSLSANHAREEQLFADQIKHIASRTDRVFAWLMVVQFLAGIIWALTLSPYTYIGTIQKVHPHIWSAVFLGGLISFPPALLGFLRPGDARNKWVMAVSQMLMGALLIHLSGGRIETHFHVFGSLAFLALYRDWRVLIPATLVVASDHILRGIFYPMSIYGIPSGAELRFIEHAIWVICEDIVLFASCRAAVKEMRSVASRQAELEAVNAHIEALVVQRSDALTAAEFRYSEIFSNSLDGIVLIDKNKCVVESNPTASLLLGTNLETKSLPFSSFFQPEDRTRIEAAFDGTLQNKRNEFFLIREEQEPIPVELGITSIAVKGVTTYAAFLRDLSQQRKLESKLFQAQKMESIGHMATGIAHEINTPNQYIGDNVRFVADSWRPISNLLDEYRDILSANAVEEAQLTRLKQLEKQADLEFNQIEIPAALEQAFEGVRRVENIIRAMKGFAHTGGGFDSDISLNRIVTGSCLISRNEWKYVAELEEDLDPNLPLISANSGELGQVVVNLVVNAAHAVKDANRGSEGFIRVKTYIHDGRVVLEVTDNGVGISNEIKNRIFEPFFTTKGVGIGTGQGLAITHAVIVERHRGEIEIDSVLGEGTTIRIKLPLVSEEILAA